MPTWIVVTQWGSKAVLILLGILSIWSVAIILERSKALKALAKKDGWDQAQKLIRDRDWPALKAWAQGHSGLRAQTLKVSLEAAKPEQVEYAYLSFVQAEKANLESGFTTLATLGSNAPFIGLFGTVLGVIQAFGALAVQKADTAAMMAGISESLVATAVGLFVAIPAVVAYNVFSRQLKVLLGECESLKNLYLSKL